MEAQITIDGGYVVQVHMENNVGWLGWWSIANFGENQSDAMDFRNQLLKNRLVRGHHRKVEPSYWDEDHMRKVLLELNRRYDKNKIYRLVNGRLYLQR